MSRSGVSTSRVDKGLFLLNVVFQKDVTCSLVPLRPTLKVRLRGFYLTRVSRGSSTRWTSHVKASPRTLRRKDWSRVHYGDDQTPGVKLIVLQSSILRTRVEETFEKHPEIR